jgi:hypothetical protein
MKVIAILLATIASLTVQSADFAFSCVSEDYNYSVSGEILDVWSSGNFDNYNVRAIEFKNSKTNETIKLNGNAFFSRGNSGSRSMSRFLEFSGPKGTPVSLEILDNLDNAYNKSYGTLSFTWHSLDKISMLCAGSTAE